MNTKKIFVLGNGFDLAHYLPTMYVHFMEAMKVVESSSGSEDLGFDELFVKYTSGDCTTKDKQFFNRVKEIYKTNELKISAKDVAFIKDKLLDNGWFQHFKHHLSDIDTWIDFENEIEKVLLSFDDIFNVEFKSTTIADDGNSNELGYSGLEVRLKEIIKDERFFNHTLFSGMGLSTGYFLTLLKNFGLLKTIYGCAFYETKKHHGRIEYLEEKFERLNLEEYKNFEEIRDEKIDFYRTKDNIKGSFDNIVETRYLNRDGDLYKSFKSHEVYKSLLDDLKDFTSVFKDYINLIINSMTPLKSISLLNGFEEEIPAVFTFNYSNTFEKLYSKDGIEVQYIHGSATNKNIVLGISDLDDNSLKKHKIYGFVKTFQKIINKTDFMFLDHESLEPVRAEFAAKGRTDYELIIWGHSLDSSDAEYIREIFELNQPQMLNRVIVKVWYHDSSYKQLANLMHIMGKDVIQKWTKQGWLIFEPAPELYQSSAT